MLLFKKLLVEGHTVVAAVRRTNILEELRQEYPQTLIVESLDVTETAQIKRVALRYPDVDVVVNNAGGSIKTGFVANIQWTNESDFYKNSTVGHLRHWIQENGEETTSGDPKKMANVIFNLSQLEHPPLRTTLGIDAYSTLEKAYQNSLSILQSQKELAESVAFEGKMGFIPS